MKRLLMIMLLGIFMLSFGSALEFDNVKDYDISTRTVTITNAYGLGDVIGQAKLNTPLNVRVGAGYQKVAEFDIWAYEDYNDALKQFTFEDMKNGRTKINRDYDMKYLTYEEVEVDDYGVDCNDKFIDIDGEETCRTVLIGSHFETREKWVKITPANLKKNEKLTIGVFTEVQVGDYVDWIPMIYGVEIEEWATWTEDLNTNLVSYYRMDDNAANTVITDAHGSNNGTASTNTNNLYVDESRLEGTFDFDGSTQYGTMANTSTYGITGSAFSINIWTNSDTFDASLDDVILSTNEAGSPNGEFDFKSSKSGVGTPAVFLRGGGEMTSNATITTGSWVMTTWIKDGNNNYLYVNGNIVATASWSQTLLDETLTLATLPSVTLREFDGHTYGLGIWDAALTTAQITQLYDGGTGIAYTDVFGVAPSVTLTSPADNANLTSANIDFIATVTDDEFVENVTLYIDGVANETNSSNFNGTYTFSKVLSEGVHNWSILAFDNSSLSNQSETRTFNYTQPPIAIDLTSPADASVHVSPPVNVSCNAYEVEGVTQLNLTINGVVNISVVNTTIAENLSISEIINFAEDEYTWGCSAKNDMTSAVSANRTFNVTYSNPVINLFSPANDTNLLSEEVTFIFNASDVNGLQNVTLYLDGVANETNSSGIAGNYTFTKNLSTGSYNWSARAVSTLGKITDSETRIFSVHTTSPNVTITAPSGTISQFTVGGNETLNYSITETGENSSHFDECWYEYGDIRTTESTDSFETDSDGWNLGISSRSTDWASDGIYSIDASGVELMWKDDVDFTDSVILIDTNLSASTKNPEFGVFKADNGSFVGLVNCGTLSNDLGVNLNQSVDIDSCFNGIGRLIITQNIFSPSPTFTYFIDNIRFQTKRIDLNCSATSTEFLYQDGFNNISVFATDEFGLTGNATSNWTYNVLEVSQTFNNETIEGLTETFSANITTSLAVSTATLVYDGTEYLGTLELTDTNDYTVSASIVIPGVIGDENKTFFWEIVLSDATEFNLTSNNITVQDIAIDDCTTGSIVIMNLSLFDEEFQTVLNGTIEVDLDLFSSDGTAISTFSQNYTNVTNAPVCITNVSTDILDYLVTALIGYGSTGYAEEFYNIQKATIDNSTIPINISLYGLDDDDATTFVMSYKGTDFLPLVGSLFNVQRRYISEGVFKSVEVVKSDDEGFAKAHFDTEGVIYRITITQDGEVIDTFDNVKVACDNVITEDCQINLNSFASQTDFTDWKQFGDITFVQEFDSSTRTKTVSYNTVDGSPANITVTLVTSDGSSEQLCSSSLFSSAGVITCVVPVSFGNGTVVSTISTNDINILSELDVITSNPTDAFGVDAFVFAFIMVISFPLIMVGSAIGVMFGLLFGALAAFMLLLADNSGLLGPTAAFTWLLVAGAILVYKMFRRER